MLRTGPFRIDLADERLWRGSDPIALRPKTWAVLRHLVERAGRLVTKQELLDAVWGEVAIEEKVLNASIAEIRVALGDDARRPRYVATVPRRGFRFIAPIADATAADGAAAERVTGVRRTRFVGREAELESIVVACRALHAGTGGVVLVAGPAGIGKSRLAAEALARADAAAGGAVLVGRCLEGGALPFWPWVELVRAALRTTKAAQVRERCGAAARELARIVPELDAPAAGAAPDGVADPEVARLRLADPELARVRLFDALALFFERATETAPVLVLEDLHWADPDSLRALQAVAARLVARPALLVATLRDDEVVPGSLAGQVLATLGRDAATQTCRLSGLPAPAARALVEAAAPGSLPEPIAEQIVAATDGNPFFLEEILRHLGELSLLRRDHGWRSRLLSERIDLPSSVVEVFARRLRRLSPACERVLDVAAVIGEEMDEALLARVVGDAAQPIDAPLAEAIAAGVLEEDPERPARYRFRHALMRAVLQGRQPGPLRRRVHLRIADALEAAADGDESALPEIALHLAASVPAGDARRAIALTVRAAERARTLLAYESEAEHHRRALELAAAAGDPAARSLETELAVRHAEALQRTGDAAAASAAFRAAASRARNDADPRWLARAALGMTTLWEFDDPDARACVEEALERLGDAEPHRALATRLRARLAVLLYPLAGTRERCTALCDAALVEARALGDPTLIGQTLVDWLAGQWYPDNLDAQRAVAEELLAVAGRAADPTLRATAHAWRAVIGLGSGTFDLARDEVDALLAVADELRQPLYRWCGLYMSATIALVRGDLPLAERLSTDAYAIGARSSPRAAGQVHAAQVLMLRREQGRADEVLSLMERDAYRSTEILLWTLPYVLVEADRMDDARDAFARAYAYGLDALPGENSRNRSLLALGAMALACAALGERAHAAELYARVAPHAGRWSLSGFGNVCFGLMGNGAGALAGCLGDWDRATAHFTEAAAVYERAGAPVALARALVLDAEARLTRGRRADRAAARALLDRAAALAGAHGLARVATLVARLRPAC